MYAILYLKKKKKAAIRIIQRFKGKNSDLLYFDYI